VSPLFDRDKPGITKSQPGFFDFVVVPLFVNFSSIFPGMHPMLQLVLQNYRYWQGNTATPAATTDLPSPGAQGTSPAAAAAANAAAAPGAGRDEEDPPPGAMPSLGKQSRIFGNRLAASVKRMSMDIRR